MSEQQIPLTADVIFEMLRQVTEQMKETAEQMRVQTAETDRRIDQKFQEVAEQMKRTDKKISDLGSRIGEIIENMVGGGNIVEQFQALNVPIHAHSRYKTFGTKGTDESGEIDIFLENGDLVILIEVKTRLTDDDVRKHIKQMEKYRLFGKDKRRLIGAVAGAVVADDVIKFAHKQGFYVIVQSGEAVEIVAQPEGFKAKEW